MYACIGIASRGEVEDTRLGAKAKNTNKIRGQGQGQPFREQTLSRPRTEMLEAKAKDQGHRRKCFKKKSSKLFQAISKREKQERSSQVFREVSGVFLHNFKNKQIPTIA